MSIPRYLNRSDSLEGAKSTNHLGVNDVNADDLHFGIVTLRIAIESSLNTFDGLKSSHIMDRTQNSPELLIGALGRFIYAQYILHLGSDHQRSSKASLRGNIQTSMWPIERAGEFLETRCKAYSTLE